MLKGTILIIDDEEKLRTSLSRTIELEGYRVFQAENSRKGLQKLEQQKDISLVITDMRQPDMNGIQLLEKIKEQFPSCEVIVITAYGTIQDGVRAMKIGAFDYINKGDGDDQILVTIDRAIDKAKMQRRILDLENKLRTRYSFEIGRASCRERV